MNDELSHERVIKAIEELTTREPDPEYDVARMTTAEKQEVIQSRFIFARQMLWWEQILVRVIEPDAEITKLTGLVEDTIQDCCKSIASVSSIN